MTKVDPLAQTPLRTLFSRALDRLGEKQKWLATKAQLGESELSEMLNGKRPMPHAMVDRLCALLDVPLRAGLLAREATEATRSYDNPEVADRVRQVFLDLLNDTPSGRHTRGAALSLEDFPFDGQDWCVVVGDRREKPPRGLGDLLALSVSSSDLMFLPGLRLPRGTTLRSDKPLRLRPDLDRLALLHANLLVIGSPAVSFASREILRLTGATFQFNIGPDTFDKEQTLLDSIPVRQRHVVERLEKLERDEEREIRRLLALFRKPGFLDPIRFKQIRSQSTRRNNDYGVIAMAPNPWSPEHIVCLCAGIHGPGTAGAIEMLTHPERFRDHPWGGVIEVVVPDEAPWEERFLQLGPKWDTEPYDPQTYIEDLGTLISGIEAGRPELRDVAVGVETLRAVHEFAKRLAAGWPQGKP